MASESTKIFEKLYVTVQYRGDANNESGLLGFASPYTKDSAFEKRKATQDKWAYGYGATVTIDNDENITVEGGGKRGGYGSNETWDASMLFIANCYPRIVNNEPVEGFQLAKSVRRYGWSGSGNVVWRISDPRGFDLEISSENFAAILNCCNMEKGVIVGKCVWGRDGAHNVLLPEASEPFQAAKTFTDKSKIKISLKDVQVGDTVELLNPNIDAKVCQFLGKYWFMTSDQITDSNDEYTGGRAYNAQQVERYLFKNPKDNKYFLLTTPKVVDITQRIDQPLDKNTIAHEINTGLSTKDDGFRGVYGLILVSPTKIDLSKVISQLEPVDFHYREGDAWPRVGNYHSRSYVVKYQGDTYITYKEVTQRNHKDINWQKLKLVPVTYDDGKPHITPQRKKVHYGGIWGSYRSHHYETVKLDTFDYDALQYFQLKILYNGFCGTVNVIHV